MRHRLTRWSFSVAALRIDALKRMLLEPFFSLAEVRAEARDLMPETGRVVHMFEMGQFVKNDVIANEDRRVNKAPIQGDCPEPRTGAPAGTLVADRNSLDSELMESGQLHHPRRKLAGG